MADWRALAKDLALADGVLRSDEVRIIRDHLLGDGKITKGEFEFLLDLRRQAKGAVKDFKVLFFDAVKTIVLADGAVSPSEAAWLEKMVMADLKIDDEEKALLAAIKAEAKRTCPEFDALCERALKS